MTESDDKLSRRYRELPREEPSAQVDELILAASRRAVSAGPRKAGARPQWMVPVSIAAVLVLGIGVSLRMQLEQPGIESSVPSSVSEYSAPPAAEPPTQAKPEPKTRSQPEAASAPAQAPVQPEAKASVRRDAPVEEQARAAAPARQAEKPLAKRIEPRAPEPIVADKRKDAAEPNPFADAPIAMAPPVPASPPAVILSAPTSTGTVSTTPPPAPVAVAPAPKPDTATAQAPSAAGAAAAPQAAPAPRAKREALASDNAAARESRALGATADPDPARELERIAKMREAGRHEEADRALTEFRRRHPDYRIPEAMWERVKTR